MTQPKRPRSHELETISERFFAQKLPENYTVEFPRYDYGVDAEVKIYSNNQATKYKILVQLKSSEQEIDGDFEEIVMKRSTYNYLLGQIEVVLLVKYTHNSKCGYYQLLGKVPLDTRDTETLTIKIPKRNNLDTINWELIQNYVERIINHKFDSAEDLRKAIREEDF